MAKRRTRARKSPAEQGIGPGRGKGGVPVPVAHQFRPGQSGNPKGRPTAGATAREHLNALAAAGLTEAQLRRIATDPKADGIRRSAAVRILRTFEHPDPADMEDMLDGRVTLRQLRQRGFNTSAIRKVKVKTRTLRDAEGNDAGVEVEREVELHDRSGAEFDRVFDRTEGRPRQQVDVTSGDEPIKYPADGAVAAADLLARVAGRLGVDAGGAGRDPAPH